MLQCDVYDGLEGLEDGLFSIFFPEKARFLYDDNIDDMFAKKNLVFPLLM